MEKEVIITEFNVTKKGVTFETNIPAKLKKGNLKSIKTFVSWDGIGLALFDDYIRRHEIADMKELRGE